MNRFMIIGGLLWLIVVTGIIYFDEIKAYFFAHGNIDTLVIVPEITSYAYSENGFYDYFKGICDEKCLKIDLKTKHRYNYSSSLYGKEIFSFIGYPIISDLELAKNPKQLQHYKKIILLHSEYVTDEIFNIISNHKNVIYLYPNSLYAEVKINNGTIQLIRGHNYPEQQITNGFGWKYDNSENETNKCQDGWHFKEVENGFMLDCYPDKIIKKDIKLLQTIRDLKK